jgi:hypothetical protein
MPMATGTQATPAPPISHDRLGNDLFPSRAYGGMAAP